MRKLFALLAVALGVVACQKDQADFGVNVGGEQEVTINVALSAETRASSANGFDLTKLSSSDYQLRYILEIYQGENCLREVKYSDDTSVAFPVRLAPGREYNFAVWADIVSETDSTLSYYNVESLKNISINMDKWAPMNEARDAFYGNAVLGENDKLASLSTIELSRPFAKVRVVATDIEDVRKFDIEPDNATVKYTVDLPTTFNAVSGQASNAQNISAFEYTIGTTYTEATGQLTVFADYIFVPGNGTICFNLDVKDGNASIKENNFSTAIPVERNKVTSIVGDVLTEGGNVSVKIENELGEKETINMVDTAEDLQQIINEIENGESGNIALGGDIDLNDLLGAGILSTRAAEPTYGLLIPAGKSVVLDLQGYTISQSKECKASYSMIQNNGNLTIIDSSEAKSGKISFKDTGAGDPTFGWGSYTISNYDGTLVVENGTIEHLGEQNKGNGEPNCHMYCALFQYNGSTIVNGGKISTPTYRSARLWSGNMTINGGNFEGQLWLQAVNNTSKLTINGGTFAPRGNDGSSVFVTNSQYDVKFAVTGGHFTTKIGASKPFGCITGGTFTTEAKEGTNTSLINDGYTWAETENGLWTVAKAYELTEEGATIYSKGGMFWFANEVNSGANYFEGKTIKLGADIDLNNAEWTPIGSAYKDHGFMGNFDGNGKIIKNLKITALTPDADQYVYGGLFGVTEGVDKDNQNYIKNLTIENVNIDLNGRIVAAAVAYPYYTALENITVKGNVSIKGGDYTSGVLAYTRRCVDAKNISIEANAGSLIEGTQTVGGVISDIQMNGGLTANYSNFKAEGLTIKGTQSVGGISGILSKQILNGATVENVTIVCDDVRKGIVSGSLGEDATLKDVVVNNVTGADYYVGATYKAGSTHTLDVDGVVYEYLANGQIKVNGNIIIANGVILNEDGEYIISNAAGMFWFANEVNVNKNAFSGKIVKLGADINLENAAWTPVGQTGATQFKGTFDGDSKTISNLNIDATAQTGANYSSGLFGWLNAAKVKNVTINGAVVKGNHNVGVIAGYLETSGCTIEACNITDAVVEGHHATNDACGDKVGGIVGHAGNSGVVVKDCVISSSTISAGRDAGQVAGAAKTDNVIGCSANNVTVTANGECTGANVRNEVIGRVL